MTLRTEDEEKLVLVDDVADAKVQRREDEDERRDDRVGDPDCVRELSAVTNDALVKMRIA